MWKLARVTPIYKSCTKNDANNYRPISVISIFSRMLERLVHGELFDCLTVNKKLTFSQSAFQKRCSIVASLISSTDSWYDSMDSRKINLTIFLDLKKAHHLWYTSRLLSRSPHFIIYLNDFEKCLEFSQASLYADDTLVE